MKLGTSIKRFSWSNALRRGNYDCKRVINIIQSFTMRPFSEKWQFMLTSPDCWLSNPVEFFLSNSTDNEKCVYLDLASKRNWADYEFKKQTSLPLYVAEDYYNIKLLESNVLLEINDKSIDFKY